MRFAALLLVAAIGCSERPVPSVSERDGGAIDVNMASCADLMKSIRLWLDSHRDCKADNDCTAIPTVSNDDCRYPVNKTAASPYLWALLEAYKKRPECLQRLVCVTSEVVCTRDTCMPRIE